MYVSKDRRNMLISDYNFKAGLWMSSNIGEYNNSKFSLYNSNKILNLTKYDEIDGEDYPLRDSCDLDEDDQPCHPTTELYYNSYINNYGNSLKLSLYNEDKLIYNRTIQTRLTTTLHPQDLNCTEDVDICSIYCENRKGTWDVQYNVCYIRQYLYNICYRVQDYTILDESTGIKQTYWRLDKPPRFLINGIYNDAQSDDTVGCVYNNQWNPYIYADERPVAIRFQMRSFLSPFIVASSITRGCSTSTLVSSFCLGPRETNSDTIIIVLCVVFSVLTLFFICYIIYSLCYKQKREERISNPSTITILPFTIQNRNTPGVHTTLLTSSMI